MSGPSVEMAAFFPHGRLPWWSTILRAWVPNPPVCPPPTSHLFPASSRFNFGSRHCLVRSLLHHLSPPWSLKNSICASWKGLRSVVGTGDQNGRAEGGRMWPCLGGVSVPSLCIMAHLPAGSALWLAARWEARPCRKGAQYPQVIGKPTPVSCAIKVTSRV